MKENDLIFTETKFPDREKGFQALVLQLVFVKIADEALTVMSQTNRLHVVRTPANQYS